MGWRNWPYWLKGGIILGTIFTLIEILFYIPKSVNLIWQVPFLLPHLFLNLILTHFKYCTLDLIGMPISCNPIEEIIISILVIAISFGFGAAIGLIIDNIKNKRYQNQYFSAAP